MVTVKEIEKENQDIVAIFFNNSLVNMLMSTLIIGIAGLLITKLRGLKKKFEMIDVLTKVILKMQKEHKEEKQKLEQKIVELEGKIEQVEENTTNKLIEYLSDRKSSRRKT